MSLPGTADVVVVGAGLAGLAAAVRLQEAGVEALVVEAADAVGGRVLDLDRLELCAFDAGVSVRRAGRSHVVGDPRRMPSALPVDLTAPVGSLRAKCAFGAWVTGLGLGSPDAIRARADRSLLDELRDRGLDGALADRVLRPFLSGVLGEAELSSSQRMVSMLLRSFARGTPSVPAVGMQALPDQLAGRLADGTLHLGVRAGAVSGSRVDTRTGSIDARAGVVATDPETATHLGAAPPSLMRSLTTWWFAAPEPPTGRPLLHVDGDQRGLLASTVVMTNAAPTYGPGDGRALVAATAVGRHPDVAETARSHAGELYGTDPSRWLLLRTDLVDGALPAHPPGQPLARRVDLGDGLFVAGDHRDTPSIQGALVSGRRAADAVVRHLGV